MASGKAMADMNIPFTTRDQILKCTEDYPVSDAEADDKLRAPMDEAALRGHMTRNDLIAVAKWKWRGGAVQKLCRENSEEDVKEITAVSFAAKSELLRIGVLLALRGVQWPMASVILHFAFSAFTDKGVRGYPVLDVRAMNTVGGTKNYTLEKWLQYVELCRTAAKKFDVDMRALDKALWAFDKKKVARRT